MKFAVVPLARASPESVLKEIIKGYGFRNATVRMPPSPEFIFRNPNPKFIFEILTLEDDDIKRWNLWEALKS